MQGNVRGKAGGGFSIQGIIKEYEVASGGNINAGDFVKYINDYQADIGTDTQLITNYTQSIDHISATKLNENTAFVVFGFGADNVNNHYLHRNNMYYSRK